MSVIVKGMEMPKNCMSCPFPAVGVDAYYCHCPTQDGKECDFKYANTIPDDCPLVEIPTPHGDLADKDKLMQEIMDSDLDHLQRDDWREVIQIVSDADVVIEAEGETK